MLWFSLGVCVKESQDTDKNGFILGVVIISRIRLVLITIMF